MDTPIETIEQLKRVGFTAYEARAYLALLACQPATAYEIARSAGLPTSKIYETVNRLTTRGVLLASPGDGNTRVFHAQPPAALMASIRNRAILETEQLQTALEQLPSTHDNNVIWPLGDEDQVRARTLSLIEKAQETILVSLWPEELAWCESPLQDAEARGVQIALVHFGEPTVTIGATYHHPVEKTLYNEKGGRGLTLVSDSSEVMIATFRTGGNVEGNWSRNQGFVTVAEDYVKHDVYITKVTRFLNAEMRQRFGEDYTLLRDVFNANA